MATRNCLFVPGFAGGELFLDLGRFWPRVKYWLGIATFVAHGYKRLDLDSPFIDLLPGTIVPGGPIRAVYGECEDWIAARALRSESFGYDWRRPVDAPKESLAARITALTADGTHLVVVAHSAGGLRAARAMQTLPSATLARIDRFITVGTPWRGSWYATAALLGRLQTVQWLAAICATGGLTLGTTETRWIQQTLASFEGLYELFPSESLQSQFSPPNALDVWVPGNYQAGGTPVNPAKLAAGLAFSATDHLPPPSVPMLNIYAGGIPTMGPFEGGPSLAASPLLESLDGDGVVPVASAVIAETTTRINLPVNGGHARLMSASGVLAALAANL